VSASSATLLLLTQNLVVLHRPVESTAKSSHSQIHARIRRLAAATFAEDLLEEDAKDLLLQSLAVAFSTNLL
ncbi:hypothetical protein ACCD00_04520, partial [Pseudomonas sp. Pseusp3]|uniref:hypothetical protein n=1 Tax=Pseudomonas sp. Pseusp3 TaxID=3243029 RepID=UPI0039B020AA